jgi:hypothetical protein
LDASGVFRYEVVGVDVVVALEFLEDDRALLAGEVGMLADEVSSGGADLFWGEGPSDIAAKAGAFRTAFTGGAGDTD